MIKVRLNLINMTFVGPLRFNGFFLYILIVIHTTYNTGMSTYPIYNSDTTTYTT